MEQHIEQLLGNLPPIKEEKKELLKPALKQESKLELKLDPISEEKEKVINNNNKVTPEPEKKGKEGRKEEKEEKETQEQIERREEEWKRLELPQKTPVVRMGSLERTLR